MDQPYHSFLTVLDVARVASGPSMSYCDGLVEFFSQQLIERRRDYNRLQEILDFP